MNFSCFRYEFSIAVILALAPLKYASLRYPVNDVILKRGKESVKTVFVTVSGGKSSYKLVI